MRYYKITNNGYIISIGTGAGDTEITEQEFTEILTTIRNKPIVHDGFDYRLKTDLTWEEYELPVPEPIEEEAAAEDYENALSEMGVDFSD